MFRVPDGHRAGTPTMLEAMEGMEVIDEGDAEGEPGAMPPCPAVRPHHASRGESRALQTLDTG